MNDRGQETTCICWMKRVRNEFLIKYGLGAEEPLSGSEMKQVA